MKKIYTLISLLAVLLLSGCTGGMSDSDGIMPSIYSKQAQQLDVANQQSTADKVQQAPVNSTNAKTSKSSSPTSGGKSSSASVNNPPLTSQQKAVVSEKVSDSMKAVEDSLKALDNIPDVDVNIPN